MLHDIETWWLRPICHRAFDGRGRGREKRGGGLVWLSFCACQGNLVPDVLRLCKGPSEGRLLILLFVAA